MDWASVIGAAERGAKPSLESAIRHLVLAADPVAENALAELKRVLVEVNDRGQR
ncbi:MAG: hypothetical protein HZY73_07360 [Micropruina sp.]|nr:MAG: hypothetical protein HZY73_07360 [Micropruina sp.]